ncbi:hypothetical protein D9613_000615 [Agrocybe pediades]|uniref:BZIP domain-containing protein n=1 Tax=Agrocybe pediades TaxID=84607 RepID=A0A8H4VSG7_9AGAR|nr:hypothetical protein D9613_000615 [Agrocybe pediades]
MLSFNSVGQSSPDASQNIQTMRLRDDPPPITQQQRTAKKRKTPPDTSIEQQQQQQQQQSQNLVQQQQQQQPPHLPPPQQQPQQPQQQPPQQPQQLQHVLPPPHALMHSIPGPLPPGYPYAPADYTPGGLPPPGLPIQPQQQQQQPQQSQSPPPSGQRTLSSSKRAEQNRKAQRAFRERRDQHVKALESRSQLLDAALASADEANRRWEECRALVDQLRVENAALRAALSQQAHLPPPNLNLVPNGVQPEDPKQSEGSSESKNDAPEKADHNMP